MIEINLHPILTSLKLASQRHHFPNTNTNRGELGSNLPQCLCKQESQLSYSQVKIIHAQCCNLALCCIIMLREPALASSNNYWLFMLNAFLFSHNQVARSHVIKAKMVWTSFFSYFARGMYLILNREGQGPRGHNGSILGHCFLALARILF